MKNLAILASIVLAIGCDNGGGGGTDAGMGDGGGTGGDAGMGTDGGGTTPDSGPTSDGNDTFATASTIMVDATSATMGSIDPAGDLDYYSFTGTAGQWIEVVVGTDSTSMTEPDTVVTIYDSSMNQIAENDDALPRGTGAGATDSEVITMLPADGTYYVLVQSFSTWHGDTPVGGTGYDYQVAVASLTSDGMLVNVDSEGGNDAASAQALTEKAITGGGASFILGTFADASDVDVYSFTITGTTTPNFSVNLMPGGTTGDGAAANPASMWITNADGTEIIARLTPSDFDPLSSGQNVDLDPSLDAGDYLLFVQAAAGADFYVLKSFRGGDNPPETMDATNGTAATAETISIDSTSMSGFVLAHLPTTAGVNDTDFFKFDVGAGLNVSVVCGSASSGSGVEGLSVTLFDSMTPPTQIAMESETATQSAYIQDQAVSGAGTYVIQISKTGQSADVTGDWVRCGVHLAAPAAP